jgi:hypothetical protein
MDKNKERLNLLFALYMNGEASAAEIEEFFALASLQDNEVLEKLLLEAWQDHKSNETIISVSKAEQILQGILVSRQELPAKHSIKMKWWRVAAAAILISAISTTCYFFIFNRRSESQVTKTSDRFSNDAVPGKIQATLTLSDGSQLVLDSLPDGTVIMQGDTKISNRGGQIAYAAGSKQATTGYNTLSTARGQVFHSLELSDGTKVWLNAASSIRFPVVFTGKERKVSITGEVYFEVAKRPQQPFIVDARGTDITVLGTHFNVNLYEDEPVATTTLFEGAVRLTHLDNKVLLRPGQQAILGKTGELAVSEAKDTEQAIAWKNNIFSFESTDIETVMRQVARWYDLDIVYHGNVSQKITGEIPRSASAVTLFKVLELAGGVHFTMNGKKVEVMP